MLGARRTANEDVSHELRNSLSSYVKESTREQQSDVRRRHFLAARRQSASFSPPGSCRWPLPQRYVVFAFEFKDRGGERGARG
jgi:hypothetical protein